MWNGKSMTPIHVPLSTFFILLRMAKDPRFERLPCMHKGTYADDCIVNRIHQVIILHNILFCFAICH